MQHSWFSSSLELTSHRASSMDAKVQGHLVGVSLLLLGSTILYFVTKHYVIRLIRHIVRKSKLSWNEALFGGKILRRVALLVPFIFIHSFVDIFVPTSPVLIQLFQKISLVSMLGLMIFISDALGDSILDIYKTYEVSKKRPIKSYVQMTKIVLVTLLFIMILSVLMNRSVWDFIQALGAMTAIVLIIFKDSLLGLVASFQIIGNDLIRIGDWIEMPKYGADGDVLDISLHHVKVQNFDKTITTIPTYALISESFKNWRGMQESGGRRIKRSFYINAHSVKFCDEEMLKRFSKVPALASYIKKKEDDSNKYNSEVISGKDQDPLLNQKKITNLGCFRAFVKQHLIDNPKISKDMTFIVRQLEPGPQGLPVELYIFSKDKVWANYEEIQSDIFDFIFATVGYFDLVVYQRASSSGT